MGRTVATPAVFLDRDGTINEDTGYVAHPSELAIYPWTAEALRLINQSGMKAIVVTNQSGVARGIYSEATLKQIHKRLEDEVRREGARIDAIYYCPHHPRHGSARYRLACECRKPQPGLLRKAAAEHCLDLSHSFVIGDKASDINLAASVGARGVLVLTGFGRETIERPDSFPCRPDIVAADLLEAVKLVLDFGQSVC
jgi:D-glycero-D-manno-heptose 1,7-bisphosphate phosphatase